jgi:amidase
MSELASWKLISKQKKNEQYARIPTNWRLQSAPSPDVTSFVGLVSTCGVLDEEELRITERYDAVGLARAIRERRLRCVDAVRAFCKVSLEM